MGHEALQPVCFMIMPFGKKEVTGARSGGAPNEVDCDGLWDKAFRPAIDRAGYTPIRADYDTGSVIVKDMLERLAFADLIVADVSLPNGNVYYEVGLRHVARETGCIMLAADWSRQLFDIDQFTTVRYTLRDGSVPDSEAEAIRATVETAIANLKGSRTPWHEFISGSGDEERRRGVFRDFSAQMSAFQAKIRAARITTDKEKRQEKIEALCNSLPPTALEIADIAIELLVLVRDGLGWERMLVFVQSLPEHVAELPLIQEQRLLAVAELGQPEEAIASLEELNIRFGETPERLGIIGGRYKRLYRAARQARRAKGQEKQSREERNHLENAIDNYTRGMELDYNQYYCSGNIADLLAARGAEGDAERAIIVDNFVVAACERAIARGDDDEWTRPTLLSAAFRAADVAKAEELAGRIRIEGIAGWQIKSAISDLAEAVDRAAGTPQAALLQKVLEDLRELIDSECG